MGKPSSSSGDKTTTTASTATTPVKRLAKDALVKNEASGTGAGAAGNGDGDKGWRVLLLRSLVQGDVPLLTRVLHDHIDVLSLPFTKNMPSWKVQWESMYWWMLRDATPLFIASAYSHPKIIQLLLQHGADRSTSCYLDRTPLDFVGECCETSSSASADVVERSASCRRLLTAPPLPASPPMVAVQFTCNIATQVVVVKTAAAVATLSPPSSSSSSGSSRQTPAQATTPTQPTTQTVYKCVVGVTWEAPLSNGALIDKYEIRHRLLPEEGDDASAMAAQDAGEDDTKGSGPTSGGGGGASWRMERAPHNRKTRAQGLVLEGLQFGSAYEFMLRSWNAAGKGDWGRAYKFRTLASPEQNDTASTKAKN